MNTQQSRIQAESELQLLFQQYQEFRLRAYPEMATYDGDHRYDDRLTDLSHSAYVERTDKLHHFQRELRTVQTQDLKGSEQLNYELFDYFLDLEIRAFETGFHLMNIDQQEGIHLSFPQLIDVQPLRSFNEYEQYFSRLQSFEKQVEDTLQNLSLALERGLTLPRCAVEQSLSQMGHMAQLPLEQMPLYAPVLGENKNLSPELQSRVRTLAAKLIQGHVQPAYQRLHDEIQRMFLPRCHGNTGLHALRDGEALYAYWVERHTRRGQSPRAIHQRGLEELEMLDTQLARITEKLRLPTDKKELRQRLLAPEFRFQSVSEMMSAYAELMTDIDAKVPSLFQQLPQSACKLKEIESWRAEAAPQAYYYPPPLDLSRPGIFYVNTSQLQERPRYSLAALTLHEAVPGHHLQLARALELPQLPAFRQALECTAFVEGWALYAESLGHEMGFYEDPLQELGAVSFSLWRAARLVVDTGLHALGWPREKACEFMRQHTLQSEADIQSEVDRYLVLPAQALAYKMGEFAIRDLKTRMKQVQGIDFKLSAFHELMLSGGSLPLDVLEKRVQKALA